MRPNDGCFGELDTFDFITLLGEQGGHHAVAASEFEQGGGWLWETLVLL